MLPIPITQPLLGAAEREAALAPLETGWLVQGPHVEAFEERFAGFTGAGHAVAVSSCSAALHLALAALGVGPGDEVVVPAFTWVATAHSAEHLGARAVFADIDPDTFNVRPDALAAAVTPRTRAVVPVHLFGAAADLDAVRAVAERSGLAVVEDAACGFGTAFRGAHVGTRSAAGCFSFHPRKSITTGEGGMVTTPDGALAERVRSLRNHGAGGGGLTDFPLLGFNYRMTDVQGAIGVAQMDRAHDVLEGRRRAAARYDALLAGLDWLHLPQSLPHSEHSYQSYVVRLAPSGGADAQALRALRDGLIETLAGAGIGARPGTHAVPTLSYYAEKYAYAPGDFPGAHLAECASLALPLFPQMVEEQQVRVADTLARAYDALRPRPLSLAPIA